jgi:hypothetical protein
MRGVFRLVATAVFALLLANPGRAATSGDPVEVLGRYQGPAFAELLEVQTWGERVVFCSGVRGLNVYDAADPTRMRLLDRTGFSRGNDLLPRCQHVAVDEQRDRLYATSHADRIQPRSFIAVIDASTPHRLREQEIVLVEESVEGVALTDDLLLVAAHEAGLLIYDRRGKTLERIATVPGLGNAWSVEVSGDLAYVLDGQGGLSVVQIGAPTLIRQIAHLDLPGAPRDLLLDGDRAYAALGSGGVALLSLADPAAPAVLSIADTPGSALALTLTRTGDTLAVADWNDIRLFRVEADQLVPRGREPLPLDGGRDSRTLGIASRGDVLFSSNWTGLVSYRHHTDRAAPDLVSRPSALVLRPAVPGLPPSDAVRLSNEGDAPLSLGAASIEGDLRLEGLPSMLQPGEAVYLTVQAEGRVGRSAGITLHSDDPDQPALRLAARLGGGTGEGGTLARAVFAARDGDPVEVPDPGGKVILLAYFATF